MIILVLGYNYCIELNYIIRLYVSAWSHKHASHSQVLLANMFACSVCVCARHRHKHCFIWCVQLFTGNQHA